MRFLLVFVLFINLFACKRNHSSVLVKVLDNETGVPLGGAKVEVIRKGKEGWFIDKEHMLVEKAYTNNSGEVLVNFKYDRGNKYALFVSAAGGYFQNTGDGYFDLKKGENSVTAQMYQMSFIKLHMISDSPFQKALNVRIDNFTSVYYSFYLTTNPLDTFVFCQVASGIGNKSITWQVDSSGFEKNYSFPIQLKGHDTTYTLINF